MSLIQTVLKVKNSLGALPVWIRVALTLASLLPAIQMHLLSEVLTSLVQQNGVFVDMVKPTLLNVDGFRKWGSAGYDAGSALKIALALNFSLSLVAPVLWWALWVHPTQKRRVMGS